MITTYRAKRRQKVGPGAWRQPGDLLPELHVARTAYSSLVTGFAAEVQITAEEFVREVRDLDLEPELEARVLDSVGLVAGDFDEEPVVLETLTDPTKHPVSTVVPPDKDAEHRIGGPTQPRRRPPATKRAARKKPARKKPARKSAAKKPEESLVTVQTADGEPDLPLRTLD